MKASLAAARQAVAAESVAENVNRLQEQLDRIEARFGVVEGAEALVTIESPMQEQLDRIEAMFDQLLESLARDTASVETNDKPRVGRPKVSK